MQEQTMEHKDTTIGIECKVEKHNNSQNRIRFKSSFANIGDKVVALTLSEHSNYLQQIQQVDELNAEINQLQQEINSNDIKALEKQLAVYKKQVDNLSKSNNTYKQWNSEFKAKIEDLQNTINELKQHNDAIAKQLEDSIDASEIKDLQKQVATLSDKLKDAENNATYWQNSYNEMLDSSDALANKNESLIAENEKLRNDNNAINETNKLLNENLIASNNTFNETKQELQFDFENKENELKETIEKQQSHIDELTEKYQSLLPSKENIPQKQHYKQLDELKDEIRQQEIEIDKLNGEIENKLAVQKSELDSEYNKEKAQMLVAYNKDLDSMKLEYNNLAIEYNTLLADVHTITKMNALFDSRHKKIIKDKEPIDLMVIQSEQLPPADEDVVEYIPKEQ